MQTLLTIVRNRGGECARCSLCNCRLAGTDIVETCSRCTAQTCTQCGCSAHPGDICSAAFAKQYQQTPEDVLSSVRKQACPSCARATVKDEGCNHMTCVCGGQWCWSCGEALNPLDIAPHYRGVGGLPGARCAQFNHVEREGIKEYNRMRRVLTARTDLPEDLKLQCIDKIDGMIQAARAALVLE